MPPERTEYTGVVPTKRTEEEAYHYWVKKFKLLEQQEAGDNTFAEVVLLPGNKNSTKETWPIKAEFSLSFGDYSIGIPNGFNPITLAER